MTGGVHEHDGVDRKGGTPTDIFGRGQFSGTSGPLRGSTSKANIFPNVWTSLGCRGVVKISKHYGRGGQKCVGHAGFPCPFPRAKCPLPRATLLIDDNVTHLCYYTMYNIGSEGALFTFWV